MPTASTTQLAPFEWVHAAVDRAGRKTPYIPEKEQNSKKAAEAMYSLETQEQ